MPKFFQLFQVTKTSCVNKPSDCCRPSRLTASMRSVSSTSSCAETASESELDDQMDEEVELLQNHEDFFVLLATEANASCEQRSSTPMKIPARSCNVTDAMWTLSYQATCGHTAGYKYYGASVKCHQNAQEEHAQQAVVAEDDEDMVFALEL